MAEMDPTNSGSFAPVQAAPAGDPFAGFSTYFWYLYQRNLHTDVVFDVTSAEGPVTFSAHKIVLSLWSPYLADKFYKKDGKPATGVNIIRLHDVTPDAFKAVLRFMYGHSIGDLDHIRACSLYKLARKFKIHHLATLCLKHLNSVVLDVSNVFDILEAAKHMQNESLVDRCLQFLQEYTKEVLESYDISAISPPMLHTLLDLPELSLPSEFELLLWTFAWGKNRVLEVADCESVRGALEEFLPKMQLLSLSNEEFAMLYRHHQDIFAKDEALSVFMNIGVPGSAPLPQWYGAERPARKFVRSVQKESEAN